MSEVFDVHQQWLDPVIGGAMIGGKVYYGLPNTDPTILSNQIDVFADRALTVALPNPQTIGIGGRVENKPWVGRRYSIQVDDRFDVTRYSSPDQGENASTGAALSLSNVQGINAITGLTPAGISQYDDQQIFTFRTVATNTGDVTINIDGLGAKPLKFNFNEEIMPGFLQADQVISFIYNSVGDKFSWINSGRGISLLTGVAGDGDTITANGGPSTIAYIDGQLYQFKPNADNTGAVTLEINSLGPIAVQNKGVAMSAGQFTIDTLYIVAYNSTGNIFELVGGANLSVPSPIGDVTPNSIEGTTIKATTSFEAASGTTINEFSTDGTLADDSDDAVPTEKAVKTFIESTNVASQAEMEAASDITKKVTPGRQQFHPGTAKASLLYDNDGTPSILGSYNISSVTDQGTGRFQVVFNVDFSDSNYAIGVCVGGPITNGGFVVKEQITGAGSGTTLRQAGAINMTNIDQGNSHFDSGFNSCIFFGDQ